MKGIDILEKRLRDAMRKGDAPGELLLRCEIALRSTGGERIEKLWECFRRSVEEGAEKLALTSALALIACLEENGLADMCERMYLLLFEMFEDARAIELDYAKFLTRIGRFAEAVRIFGRNFESVIGLNPEITFDNLLHIAAAYEGSGDGVSAEAVYGKLRAISEKFCLARLTLTLSLRLARLKIKAGRTGEAEKMLEEAAGMLKGKDVCAEYLDILIEYSRVARVAEEKKKRLLRALNLLKRKSDDPRMVVVNEELGDLLAFSGDRKNALNHLRSALFYARESGDEVSVIRIKEKIDEIGT